MDTVRQREQTTRATIAEILTNAIAAAEQLDRRHPLIDALCALKQSHARGTSSHIRMTKIEDDWAITVPGAKKPATPDMTALPLRQESVKR